MSQVPDFAGQLLPEHMAELKKRGYASVINNRPDGEEAGQPTSAQVEAAAREQGLSYVHQPIVPGQMSEFDMEAFARHFAELNKPVMMFCRTGNRSSTLYQGALDRGMLDAGEDPVHEPS